MDSMGAAQYDAEDMATGVRCSLSWTDEEYENHDDRLLLGRIYITVARRLY